MNKLDDTGLEKVSVIIPAYNEEGQIGQTLATVVELGQWIQEIIVVDDGSIDQTYTVAKQWTDQVLRLPYNEGKSRAVQIGCQAASAPILLLLDADLQETAVYADQLVEPLWRNEVEMTVAIFPPATTAGFGLVKRLARWGIYKRTGHWFEAPLCGQRAIRRAVFEACYRGDQGFGLEVGLTLDCLEAGFQVQELMIPFAHRQTGKDLAGFIHRFKQGIAVSQAFLARR